jgi:hypothetical protein
MLKSISLNNSQNLKLDVRKDSLLSNARPDFVTEVLYSKLTPSINAVGEVKPNEQNKEGIAVEFLLIGLFGANRLQTEKLIAVLIYQVIGKSNQIIIKWRVH